MGRRSTMTVNEAMAEDALQQRACHIQEGRAGRGESRREREGASVAARTGDKVLPSIVPLVWALVVCE